MVYIWRPLRPLKRTGTPIRSGEHSSGHQKLDWKTGERPCELHSETETNRRLDSTISVAADGESSLNSTSSIRTILLPTVETRFPAGNDHAIFNKGNRFEDSILPPRLDSSDKTERKLSRCARVVAEFVFCKREIPWWSDLH